VTSGTPSSRAFRSQRAWSTAEIAQKAMPGRPALRTVRPIASHAARTSIASALCTTSASCELTSFAAAASQYV